MPDIRTPHPGGRPTIMTDQTLQKLREAFLMGCTDVEACLYANIATGSLYNYQLANPEFLKEKEELKQAPVLKARNNLMLILGEEEEVTIKKKDGTLVKRMVPTARAAEASKWYLERKKKGEFSTRTENVNYNIDDIEKVLDKVETNYDDIARQAERQMVENDPLIQDQGQGGESQNVQTEHNAAESPSGEEVASVQPHS